MNAVNVSIIVPTYKEAKNITPLSEQIDRAMKDANLTYEIIVVDDDSKDGIIEAIEKIKDRYNIELKVRKSEKGLSSAVISGFGLVTGEVVVIMDADLSHPPAKIPELVAPILDGSCDFMIGSRFVKGGSAHHFNWYRKLNAWLSKMIARPFTRVSDPMAGFFAFPGKMLNPLPALNPLGFKIGLEMIVKASPKRISEVPIQFQERLFGESKLSLKEQIYYLIHITRLFEYKYKTLAEFTKFCLIGGFGMMVDLTFVYLSMQIFVIFGIVSKLFQFRIARVIGFIFAVTSNFLLNRRFTFSRAEQGNIYRQYLSFFLVSLIGFTINWLVSVYLYEHIHFFNTHYLTAAFMGILGGTVINFMGSKLFVFKHRKSL
ncbi:MAG: Undecaprenyl-phosphate mannosyltransferase [Syntrophus sp. PtaB.Bin075]|nr:MAG: Undecaprenyl-phosphate mannosyltransferase [Syntrophus sp. PtaB.Bin075]